MIVRGEDEHTHYADGRPVLMHAHYRGSDSHQHSEEIELVVARLLHKSNYTGLSPVGQRAVAKGIAAMRQALGAALTDERNGMLPPPDTGELRAPLVTRTKGEKQTTTPGDASGHPWTLSNTARCGQCFRQSRRRLNPDTGKQYGPAVIFPADDCPNRPVGRR